MSLEVVNVEDLTDEICQERCESFADITNTDTALAQCYLQDRDWDLERSISDFFEDKKKEDSVVILFENNASNSYESEQPTRLTVISWNIDGLDDKNLKLRTKSVCKYIKMEMADVALLQEVVPQTQELIKKYLPEYLFLPGNDENYYTAILLNKNTVKLKDNEVIDFNSTSMGRNLLYVDVEMGSIPFCFYTSHLESTGEFSASRKAQLSEAFMHISKVPEDKTVLFAGDMNLRDKELVELGGLPVDIQDVWQITGQRKECSYTWDTTRNENHGPWGGRFKPRCRFDRMYLRNSTPAKIKPTYFGLIGLERLKPHTCFPSDHWGLVARFDMIPSR